MRLCPVKKQSSRGSITLLMLLAIPVMVAALAIVIDIGRIVVVRARLEMAADRAAYAGSSVLTDGMNRIAKENWNIYKAWRVLKEEFRGCTQQNDSAARQSLAKYRNARDLAQEAIDRVAGSMNEKARTLAFDVFLSNAPGATAEIFGHGISALSDDIDPQNQRERPSYSRVEGTYIDPTTWQDNTFPEEIKYLIKPKTPDVYLYIQAQEEISPMMLGALRVDKLRTIASSAAQTFGGSIEKFALKETEDIETAEAMVDEDGFDGLYHTAMVPMWTVGEGF